MVVIGPSSVVSGQLQNVVMPRTTDYGRINPLSNRSGDVSPPRRSDIGFIVKHLPKRLTQKPHVRQA